MPKVYLSQNRVHNVTPSEYQRILEAKRRKDQEIKVGNEIVSHSKITGFEAVSELFKIRWNLAEEKDKKDILEFEKELLDYQSKNSYDLTKSPPYPIDHYGSLSHRKDWVVNPLLGLVHWSWVKLAMEKKIIYRQDNGNWSILGKAEGDGQSRKVDTRAYDVFEGKMMAYRHLWSLREMAKKEKDEDLDNLAQHAEEEIDNFKKSDELKA